MNDLFRLLLLALFAILCIWLIFLIIFSLAQPEARPATAPQAQPEISISIPKEKPECSINGENCTSPFGCEGRRICRAGKWSECIISISCIPGDKYGCSVDSCASGYQTCNSCGTGYGDCLPR